MATEPTLAIGEFSRSTLLSARQLRDYHDVGLLLPSEVDESSGYRRYRLGQVDDAICIRRLRELRIPLARIRTVLDESDPGRRAEALNEELDRVERSLADSGARVAALRESMGLESSQPVAIREFAASTALVKRGRAGFGSTNDWCEDAFGRLYAALAAAGAEPAGPGSASYAEAFYSEDIGEVRAWVPLARGVPDSGPLRRETIPGGRYAVTVHAGDLTEVDRSYARLGRWVATNDEGLPLPIREHYLIGPADTDRSRDWRTEVCWPLAAKSQESNRTRKNS